MFWRYASSDGQIHLEGAGKLVEEIYRNMG